MPGGLAGVPSGEAAKHHAVRGFAKLVISQEGKLQQVYAAHLFIAQATSEQSSTHCQGAQHLCKLFLTSQQASTWMPVLLQIYMQLLMDLQIKQVVILSQLLVHVPCTRM